MSSQRTTTCSLSAPVSLQSVQAHFEQQVALNGESLAIRSVGESLSYTALNEAANRIAHAVLASGPASETVAVVTGHNGSTVAALLGVLKAGKIFVPLDPKNPVARLRQILADSEARVLLSDRQHWDLAEALLDDSVQLVDLNAAGEQSPAGNLTLPIAFDTPACLLYTSGSTGVPKGVLQNHGNMLHRSSAMQHIMQIGPRDRLAVLTSCSVGLGMTTVLQGLLNGASVHLFDVSQMGVGDLAPWMSTNGITVFSSTTSTFRHFAGSLVPDDIFPTVRSIRVGGEQTLRSDFELYRQHFAPQCQFVCGFAATETGPVTAFVMTHDSVVPDVIPAGQALPGTSIVILDEKGGVRPAGEIGEIAVKSRVLSPGYWHDAQRTASTFLDVPDTGEKLYRTGDLGVLLPGGCLEHRGRNDFRIKLRGFRIELEEIERCLHAHASISAAVVIAKSQITGHRQLVAFVVPRKGHQLTADLLRTHLRRTLPEHMVPSQFELADELPRTASGKIDRKALHAAKTASPAIPAGDEPQDMVEMCLKNLWEHVLGAGSVTSTANFFEIGGDSLLAARLIVAIERTLGAKIPLSSFLTAPTITQQAELVHRNRARAEWSILVPIRTIGNKPPLFCVHIADGNVLGYRDLIRNLPVDQPVYGLQSRGLDGIGRMHSRIEDMARDYIAAIRTIQPEGPYALCGWSFGGFVAFEMARQMEQAGHTVGMLGLLDSYLRRSKRSRCESRPFLRRMTSRGRRAFTRLLFGPGRVEYFHTKFQALSKRLQTAFWGLAIRRWHRRGGWLPRALRSIGAANVVALHDYVPQQYGGRVTLFRAAEHDRSNHEDLGWRRWADGGVDIHEVPGDHRNMVFDPHAPALARAIARCLDDTWAATDTASAGPLRRIAR